MIINYEEKKIWFAKKLGKEVSELDEYDLMTFNVSFCYMSELISDYKSFLRNKLSPVENLCEIINALTDITPENEQLNEIILSEVKQVRK